MGFLRQADGQDTHVQDAVTDDCVVAPHEGGQRSGQAVGGTVRTQFQRAFLAGQQAHVRAALMQHEARHRHTRIGR